MAKESGLIDINLTKANVLNIFVYVQNDGNIMDDEVSCLPPPKAWSLLLMSRHPELLMRHGRAWSLLVMGDACTCCRETPCLFLRRSFLPWLVVAALSRISDSQHLPYGDRSASHHCLAALSRSRSRSCTATGQGAGVVS